VGARLTDRIQEICLKGLLGSGLEFQHFRASIRDASKNAEIQDLTPSYHATTAAGAVMVSMQLCRIVAIVAGTRGCRICDVAELTTRELERIN
jgi:hypothetical protein